MATQARKLAMAAMTTKNDQAQIDEALEWFIRKAQSRNARRALRLRLRLHLRPR